METAALTAGFMAFVTEMFAPLLLCSSIPLGSPPVQDPNLGRIAPQECIFYVGWAGIGTPDAKSSNRAERFLADPEIRHMRAEAARRFRLLMKPRPASANGDANAPMQAGPFSIPSEFSEDAEFWCELLVTRPCAGFVSHFTTSDDWTGYHGAFVVNVGDAASKVAAMLKRYRKLAKDFIAERNVDGHIEYRAKTDWLASDPRSQAVAEKATGDKNVALEIQDPLRLRWTLWDNYLIVVWGHETPAKIVKRMKGAEPEWFAAFGKDLLIERRAATLRLSLETLAANNDRCPNCPDWRDFARQIRDTHLRSVTLVTGLGHDDFVSQLLVETDDIAGTLLKTMVNRPLKAEDLAVIPRDATLAMALRVNPNLIATGLRLLDAQIKESKKSSDANADKSDDGQPPQNTAIDVQNFMMLMAQSPTATAQETITRLCRKPIDITLDDKLCTELAASLDDSWRLYTSPGEGSSIFNGMTGVVHVKDAARLTKLFDKLAARKPAKKAVAKTAAKASKSDEPKSETWAVRKTRFADHDVYYMVRAQGESAGVLTWCLVKDELVCSLSPQNVKAYLLRQPGGSLADEPAVTDALRDKQSPTMMVYEDSREMFRLTYPFMQGWAMVMASQNSLPSDGIDPMLLPAAPTIAKYLRPAVSTLSVVPKGVQLTMHQSLPNGNLGATLYCVLCSLLPANGENFTAASPIPMAVPMYSADPTRRTQELIPSDAAPAATAPTANAATPATVPTTPCTPAPLPAPGPDAPAWNPTGNYVPAPANATAAPCVPGPIYPSTRAPELYSPANSPAPQPAWTYASATNTLAPYAAGGYAPGYGAPMSSSPAYGVPCMPPPPPNQLAPTCYPAPIVPNGFVPSAPPGYTPTVVYVPMVIYLPMAAAPAGNPAAARLPAVYPPPSYTPTPYTPPQYMPSGSYVPPPPAPPTYSPASLIPRPRIQPSPSDAPPATSYNGGLRRVATL